MNPDPNDIVRQALENLTAQNELAAARIENARLKAEVENLGAFRTNTIIPNEILKAENARLKAEGERMRRILADLQEVETNAVTKAVIREAIQRWADALGDGR